MNPWQVLGVEPGSDRKTIKRAYTRLLKDVQPEDRPDEFMQLRQAYEWALSTLDSPQCPMVFAVEQATSAPAEPFEWGHTESARPPGSTPIEDAWYEPEVAPPPSHTVAIHDDWAANGAGPEPALDEPEPRLVEDHAGARQQGLNRLVSAMARLLEDPERCNDPARWEPLLMAPELNDVQARSAVGGWLLPQVIRLLQSGREECPLSARMLVRLDDRFQWSTDASGHLPVIEDQLLRVCLLIEAARETLNRPRRKMGWEWLAHTLFSFSGRSSRVEFLVGAGISTGLFTLLALVKVTVAGPELGMRLIMALMLAMVISLFSLVVKRVRDAGIHPLLAIVVGALFPASWLFFLFAAPKDSDALVDPRLEYSQAFDRSYREYYVANDKSGLLKRLRERVTGIHPGIYLILAGVWGGSALLLSW